MILLRDRRNEKAGGRRGRTCLEAGRAVADAYAPKGGEDRERKVNQAIPEEVGMNEVASQQFPDLWSRLETIWEGIADVGRKRAAEEEGTTFLGRWGGVSREYHPPSSRASAGNEIAHLVRWDASRDRCRQATGTRVSFGRRRK